MTGLRVEHFRGIHEEALAGIPQIVIHGAGGDGDEHPDVLAIRLRQ